MSQPVKTLDDLVELVRTMRLAQKEFFRTRSRHDLLQAKKHEAVVDAAIKAHDKKIAEEKQASLFGVK
jgi:hypothetical protein